MPTERRVPCQERGQGFHGGWRLHHEIHQLYDDNIQGTTQQLQGEPEAREQTAPHQALQVNLATETSRDCPPGEVANPSAVEGVLNQQ